MSSQAFPVFADPNLVPSLLDEASSIHFSVVTLTSQWPQDLQRLVKSLAAWCGAAEYEVVAVINDNDEARAMAGRLSGEDERVRPILFTQNVGFGGGRNAGILRSKGEVVVLADTSVEATGDFLTPIGGVLVDSAVGLVGKWGLVTPDLRHFHEEEEGECDALQAYCMGFRRSDVGAVGLLDANYKFYRNADIDWSMKWRDKGFRLMAVDLPLQRHEHREWESLTPDQRDKRSRDNFNRFLRTWRDRADLVTGRGGPHDPAG